MSMHSFLIGECFMGTIWLSSFCWSRLICQEIEAMKSRRDTTLLSSSRWLLTARVLLQERSVGKGKNWSCRWHGGYLPALSLARPLTTARHRDWLPLSDNAPRWRLWLVVPPFILFFNKFIHRHNSFSRWVDHVNKACSWLLCIIASILGGERKYLRESKEASWEMFLLMSIVCKCWI